MVEGRVRSHDSAVGSLRDLGLPDPESIGDSDFPALSFPAIAELVSRDTTGEIASRRNPYIDQTISGIVPGTMSHRG